MTTTSPQLTNADAGYIGAQHVNEVRDIFGAELAAKIENARPQETFLGLLFADFAAKRA